MRLLAIFVAAATLANAACLEISSSEITAGDLARAVPVFQALDPSTQLGFMPLPGAERVLSSRELRLIARQHSLDVQDQSIPDLCVKRQVRQLTRDEIQKTLSKSLGMPDAQVDVVDFSNQPLPPGDLEFRVSGLNRPPRSRPDDPVIWRGRLVYDGRHSANIWARVRISVQRTWLVAAEDITAGQAIRAADVQQISGRTFPFPASSLQSPESIVGKVARRGIPRGQRIAAGALQDPLDVVKGETVRVNVTEGLASIALDAVARTGGRKGDVIVVHNPSTGRDFRAVIEDRGQVSVPSPAGN
jgi:flagella basal body P-ring formation protein FlgA